MGVKLQRMSVVQVSKRLLYSNDRRVQPLRKLIVPGCIAEFRDSSGEFASNFQIKCRKRNTAHSKAFAGAVRATAP